jgi:hypothetical protein
LKSWKHYRSTFKHSAFNVKVLEALPFNIQPFNVQHFTPETARSGEVRSGICVCGGIGLLAASGNKKNDQKYQEARE